MTPEQIAEGRRLKAAANEALEMGEHVSVRDAQKAVDAWDRWLDGNMDALLNAAERAEAAERERRAEPKPTRAYQVTAYLSKGGVARLHDGGDPTVARRRIRWTDDGRVWIESADHREVAHGLRGTASWLQSQSETALAAICRRAADLLDGGESC